MELEVSVRGLIKEACRLADSCDDVEALGRLACILHSAVVSCEANFGSDEPGQSPRGREGAWQQILLYLAQFDTARQRLGVYTTAALVRAIFFWLHFEQWTALLLSVSGQLNHPRSSHQQQRQQRQPQLPAAGARLQQLLAGLLDLAPAPVLLQTLVSHLSLVTPLEEPAASAAAGRGTAVTARGADLAAAFLARRFAESGGDCPGVSELLVYLCAAGVLSRRPAEDRPSGIGAVGEGGEHSGQGRCSGGPSISPQDEAALRHLMLLLRPGDPALSTGPYTAPDSYSARYDVSYIATLLVSVPDRAAGLLAALRLDDWGPWPSALPEASLLGLLAPKVFYWRLLQRLLAVLADPGGSLAAVLAWRRRQLDELAAPLSPQGSGVPGRGDEEGSPATGGVDGAAAHGFSSANAFDGSRSRGVAAGPTREVSPAGLALLEPLMASAAADLLGEVLERLCKRGHAATAADALLACTGSLHSAYDIGPRGVSSPTPSASASPTSAGGDSGDAAADAASIRHQRLREGCEAALVRLADAGSPSLERLLVSLLDRAVAAALAVGTAAEAAGASPPHLASSSAPGSLSNAGITPGRERAASQQQEGQLVGLQAELERQRRREVLLGLSPPLGSSALAAALEALSWLLAPPLVSHPAVSYILSDRLLLSLQRPPLPLDCLQLLAALLTAAYPATQPVAAAAAAAAAWGDAAGVTRTSLQRQAYLTQVLLFLLARLDRAQVEGTAGLLTGLLAGVSERLGSPLVATQRQAMRVGRAFSLVLDPASDLFGDMGDLGLAAEELWPGALPRQIQWCPASAAASISEAPIPDARAPSGHVSGPELSRADGDSSALGEPAASTAGDGVGADRGDTRSVCTATDSDDEEEEDEEEELRPLGSVEEMEGEPEEEAWRKTDPSSLQLRALAAALRKQDDVNTVLGALKRVEEVIRAAPDELGLVAPELVRSLLHCRVPEWAEQEEPGERPLGQGAGRGAADGPAEQRRRSLVALLTMAPLTAGDALVPEVYSPHLDMHQRLTLLDALSVAAVELADPRVAPRLTQGTGGRPVLQRPDLLQPRVRKPLLQGGNQAMAIAGRTEDDGEGLQRPMGRRGPRTRVWAPAALRKRREEEEAAAAGRPAPGEATFRNRFADVALRWAAGLLREVDRVKHGVDLLGRDHQVLGRLLTTLATFAEAASGSGALPPLANATLELIRSPQVHGHPEPYVRRAALLAAGQVLAQLPPAAVAGALLGGGTRAAMPGSLAGVRESRRAEYGDLAERLEWVSEWCRSTSDSDLDAHCRMMAQACVNLQADLASRCLTSLQDAAAAAAPLAPTLPNLDLARTARLLAAASPTASLPPAGGGGWAGAATAAFVNDWSAG